MNSYLELEEYLTNSIKKFPRTRRRSNASGTELYKHELGCKRRKGYLVESLTLGKTKFFLKSDYDRIGGDYNKRPINIKYKKLRKYLDSVANNEFPEFRYNAITCNHNFKTIPHYDGSNTSDSIIYGVGNYKGGELVVENNEYDIKYKWMRFNGKKNKHWTKEFSGDRWTFVYYNC